ncbi:MAG: asparagine synthase (glutamine-hydrolyzing) [Proteobacteria bacterium]|nr:asparagine synthase (glutamine-hydrolyzing) [Pseudomonadota bacterium]
MCGIAGYVATREATDLPRALRRMAGAIAHRGPDDEGFFETVAGDERTRIGFAHRRLSIIDLSTGHQPMSNADGSLQIVFNGEIYNFQALREELIALGYAFQTRSDTETILNAYAAWGEQCVSRFRGMFAFAIWDAPRNRVFIARDRFGKKPLFFHERDGLILFASEIKAVLAFPGVEAALDREQLGPYLTYRYVPGPATLFRGIRKLMPGSLAVIEGGRVSERRYYSPPDRAALVGPRLDADPVGSFLDILRESVRIRMIADVPFGAFLSGGVDSSAVVALMSEHSSLPVKTFSVGFSDAGYSELTYARVIAERFRTDHHELTVSESHLMEHLPALVRFRDAPVAEPSDIPIYLLSREARRSVKMVLTGEGSDEFLGGYPKHVWEQRQAAYQLLPAPLRRGLLEPLVRRLPYRFRRVKTAVANLALADERERQPRWFGALSAAQIDELLTVRAVRPNEPDAVQFDTEPGDSRLRRILYFDQTSWLPDNLLERGDRMTMAASLEARMPFVDHELAAYVSSLPDSWRVRGGQTKRILREAVARLLPREILERPKVGFRVPVNEWFRTTMKDYLIDLLTGPSSHVRDYCRAPVLDRYLREHVQGRQNHEKLLWCLLNLEIWHREYGIS